MKIGDAPKAGASSRSERKRGPSAAAPAAVDATAAAGKIELAGIPEMELTPRVREALVSLMQEVQTLRGQLAWSQDRIYELERIADSDPLLDIYNRRAFVRELDRALAMVERYGMKVSLVFVDLNELKSINDKMGHGAGDAALAHVANVLSANLRQTDAVGRLGGDEFGLLLTQADQQTAELKAAQLSNAVSATPVSWKDRSFIARISCGVVEIAKGLTAHEAIERADSAMYKMKARKNSG